LWNDPRYDAESWMRAHIGASDTVETYGQNAYLPRFTSGIVTRIGETPLSRRNPQPMITERQESYSAPRDPRFIVVSDWWLHNYLVAPPGGDGRVVPKVEQVRLENDDARRFFIALKLGELPYRLAHESRYVSPVWPVVQLHESTGESIRIFERVP